jgi:hypothetical protein
MTLMDSAIVEPLLLPYTYSGPFALYSIKVVMATRSRSKSAQVALPPIAALFHVVFDRKVGYVTKPLLDARIR